MTPLTYGSVFTGIAGFDLAFDRAGMACRWQVEIDEQCHRVLERHYPFTPRHHDIRDVGAHNLERVDIICGGWPCQDLSVAGQRAGLTGARSGLFYEAIRVIRELEPALVLLENVPGLISSHAGRDFAAVLLAFRELGARDICWRTLDAQYFGVPQRRRRVFLVADFAGERAAEILFESEGVSGDSPKGRKAGAGLAASLTSGTATGRGVNRPGRRQEDGVNLVVCAQSANGVGTCGADDNQAQAGHLVARGLTSSNQRNDGDTENFVYQCQGSNVGPMGTLREGDGSVTSGVPFVTHALTGEGFDASEDGTGRGTPLVVNLRGRDGGATAELGGEISPALRSSQGGGDKTHVLAFDTTQVTSDKNYSQPREGDKDHPLAAGAHAPAVAFAWQQGDDSKHGADGRGRSWITRAGDYAAGLSRSRHDAVAGSFGVRRLTPTECSRLMGFPDGWCAADADGTAISDSVQYRMLGNSVAVPVILWIAQRMKATIRGGA